MKKLLSLLLALSFTVAFAYDDDDDDDYYEDEAPKKAAKKAAPAAKKAAKASSESGDSRMGFAVGFNGGLDRNRISFVYDLGNGMEFGVGLGVYRHTNDNMEDPDQTITIVPSFSYELGKGLLNYGIGVDVGVVLNSSDGNPDGTTDIFLTPFFYTSAELVKNVSLKLTAGINVDKPDSEISDMRISFATSGTVIFYFL